LFNFYAALGNGDGTFVQGPRYIVPKDYFISTVIADFNNDGIPDVGYAGVNAYCDANLTGDVGYFPGNGDGTFGTVQSHTSPYSCPGVNITVGDFNGDGVVDVVETPGFGIGLMLGQGKTFETLESYGAGFSYLTVVGDVNNDGAPDLVTLNTAALTVVLNASGVHTTLTSSPNPSVSGQSVTFTATVAASSAFQPAVTGTVTFKDGSQVLATASLSSGQATFTTSTLAVGKHNITATYSGDANFIPGYTAAIVQTVNQ
jgi:hypothetical protein